MTRGKGRRGLIITDWFDVPATPSNSYLFLRMDWETRRWFPCTLSLLSLDKVAEKVPDEFLFSQIVALARIPPSGVETLRNGLIEELYEEWCWHSRPELSTGRILSTPTEKDRVRSRMLKKIARSLTILAADLKELNDEEVRFVDGVWAPTNKRSRNTGPTILSCKQMVPMAELFGKLLLKKPSARRRPRKGRPAFRGFPRPFGHGSFNQFVLRLLWDVRLAGGRLTLDKNDRTGTLMEALDLLRPYLPPALVPKSLPAGTLARIKALDQKVASARPSKLRHPDF